MVVGKKQAVKVFEPLAMAGEDGVKDYSQFLKGIELCRQGNWPGAKQAFESLPGRSGQPKLFGPGEHPD